MQNKGSALVFLFVLLVMCLGIYGAVSTLMKGGGTNVVALETLTPTTGAEATVTDSTPVATDTPAETPTPHSEVSTPVVPTATPVPPATPAPPPQPTPTPTPTPTGAVPNPTPMPPVAAHLFTVTRNERDCSGGNYIRGTVYAADGNGLPGIYIRLYDNQAYDERKESKAGDIDMGAYDFPMGPDGARFYLEIVDNIGRPVSAPEMVDYEPGCINHVDWQRVQ